ncbi:MAG: AAA family ATPase, partial [candidate division NC10 bacterium]
KPTAQVQRLAGTSVTDEFTKPAIAILPFENASGEAGAAILAMGLTEDIITEFSKLSGIDVIAMTSILAIADKNLKVQQIGAKLQVSHVLRGSIRATQQMLRVTAQLFEIRTGKHVRTKLEDWGRQEETLKRETAERDRQVTLLRTQQQGLQQDVAEVRIRSTSLQERKEALGRSMERLEADLARERTREVEIRHEEEEARSREARLTQEIGTLQDSLGTLGRQETHEAQDLQQLQGKRDQHRHTLLAHEEALKVVRKDLTNLQQQLASIATKRAAVSTERSMLQKRMQEEASEGDVLQELLQGGDPPQDPEVLEQEVEELRQKMTTMGPINMAALEEYEALSERHRFLTDQAEDLNASATSLKATIAEINRTIHEFFGKTLASVSQQLNGFWQRLFGGGEAELVLSEGDETQEPGVEIRVRVPGKRTTTLSLLSGGEKTLGAIALLMALWATRPSPFIVLDEVDAALDDLNVDRFASLIRELALTSQFILVTHHPRTIEVADLLYGITMEEPGISKLISVQLAQQAEQPVRATAP